MNNMIDRNYYMRKPLSKREVLKWCKENPKATMGQMKKEFLIDGIQPSSYVQRENHSIRVPKQPGVPMKDSDWFFKREPYKSKNGRIAYAWDTKHIFTYAMGRGHLINKSAEKQDMETAALLERATNNGIDAAKDIEQSLGGNLDSQNEIKCNRFLTESEIIKGSHRFNTQCGVYFLISMNEIVYVGQSINIPARLAQHRNDKDKVFDSYAWIPVEQNSLDIIETVYILMFTPKYNGKVENNGKTNIGLGLPISYRDILAGNVLKTRKY